MGVPPHASRTRATPGTSAIRRKETKSRAQGFKALLREEREPRRFEAIPQEDLRILKKWFTRQAYWTHRSHHLKPFKKRSEVE